MPHITVAYTPNLTGELDIDQLLDALHQTAFELDVFPRGRVRTLAACATSARVGEAPENGFVRVQVTIAPGRSEDVRSRIADELFAALDRTLAPLVVRRPVGFQLMVDEFEPAVTRSSGSVSASPTTPVRP